MEGLIILINCKGLNFNMKISSVSIWFAILNFIWNLVPTITICTDGLMNCQTCLDDVNCATCYPSYGLIQPGTGLECSICQVGSCSDCSTSVYVCRACNDPQGVRLSGASYTCVPCDAVNCIKCSRNASICQQCNSSIAFTGLQNGSCANCIDPNCAVCLNDTSLCQTCKSGYGVTISGGCIACIVANSNCALCTTASNCIYCLYDYGPSMGRCVACLVPNCNLCSLSALSCLSCAAPFGLNNVNGCEPCARPHCIECSSNYLTCTDCQAGFGVVASGSCSPCADGNCAQCGRSNTVCTLCKVGFGIGIVLLGLPACVACDLPCSECLNSDYTQCTACLSGYYLVLTACFPCMANCLQCSNASVCTTCMTTYYLDPTNLCIFCPLRCSSCIYNPNFNQPKCTSCYRGSQFDPHHVPRICREICGDGWTSQHPCDNALGINYDGCDDDCQVMTDFVCNVSNVTGATLCSYTGQLQMEITYFYKNPVANDFTMKIKIFPPLYIHSQNSQTQINSIFAIDSNSLAVSSVSYNSLTSELLFKGQITGPLSSDDQITIKFMPTLGASPEYVDSVNSSVIMTIDQTVYFYSPLSLSLAKIVLYVCYALPVLGWISFFLGVILRKLSGLQAMFVLQFSLFIMVKLNSDLLWPFEQTHPMRFTAGFNYAFIQQDSTISKTAPYFSQFHLNQQYFINNYNLTPLALQVLSLLYLLFTTVKMQKFIRESKNLQKDFLKKEDVSTNQLETLINRNEQAHIFLMHSSMVFLAYFAFCSTLYFTMYSAVNIPSLAMFALGAAILSFTLVRFYMDPCSFDYFRFQFYMSQIAMNHYFLHALVLVASAVLVAMEILVYAAICPLVLLFLYTLLYRPYKQIRDNLRSAFNLLIMCCLAGFRVYLGLLSKKQLANNGPMTIFMIIFIVLLPLVVILSLASTIYSYVQELRLLKQKEMLNDKKLSQVKEKTRRILFELGIVSINTNMAQIKNETTFRELIDSKYNIKMVSNKLRDEFVREELMRANLEQRVALTHNLIEASNSTSKHVRYKQEIKLDLMLKKPKRPQTDQIVNNFARERHSPQIMELAKIERKGSISKACKLEGKMKPVDEIDSEHQIAKTVLTEQNKFVNLRGAVEYVREQQQMPVDINADLYMEAFNNIEL